MFPHIWLDISLKKCIIHHLTFRPNAHQVRLLKYLVCMSTCTQWKNYKFLIENAICLKTFPIHLIKYVIGKNQYLSFGFYSICLSSQVNDIFGHYEYSVENSIYQDGNFVIFKILQPFPYILQNLWDRKWII